MVELSRAGTAGRMLYTVFKQCIQNGITGVGRISERQYNAGSEDSVRASKIQFLFPAVPVVFCCMRL